MAATCRSSEEARFWLKFNHTSVKDPLSNVCLLRKLVIQSLHEAEICLAAGSFVKRHDAFMFKNRDLKCDGGVDSLDDA